MKSFVLLSLLIILVLVDFSTSQSCWRRRYWLDRCYENSYVKGLYRYKGYPSVSGANCCSVPPPNQNKAENCISFLLRNELKKYVYHLIEHY